MDYLKKSRIEEVLIAILGKGTVTSQLISRIEKILDAIRVKGSYDGIAMSEVEEILVCILLGKRFEKPTHSRIAAMLKVKANGGEYTELRKSRVEELIFEWINAVEHATYTGTLPATLQTIEGYLESYKIYGNTVQEGTPTPENPIMPSGCGVRTENLFKSNRLPSDTWTTNTRYYMNGGIITAKSVNPEQVTISVNNDTLSVTTSVGRGAGFLVEVKPSTEYRLVFTKSESLASDITSCMYAFVDTSETIGQARAIYGDADSVVFTTDSNTNYIYFVFRKALGAISYSNIMLVEGSTPLPYEPYGYKLPILSNSIKTDIYLGEVETTRQIKKLVLTGQETGWRAHQLLQSWFLLLLSDLVVSRFELCTHYKPSPNAPGTIQNGEILVDFDGINNRAIFRDTTYTTLDDFKTYIQQQYAAGTPVTVWYVLAEPENNIVNEPLMKIGDYADTIDSTQSTAQIPTAAGSTTIGWDGEGLAPSEVELTYLKPK